ncbi:MAG: hypothetical protein A2V90_04180 [Gammaproteobacteria bacterium RBG_16_57_12]|nr:MAG: hypothetical protein A2V90_04180 [Gammaproteobacteria bacterium RBG_16_57_12]
MKVRPVAKKIQAVAISEGAGVTVYRTLGTPGLRHLDPFLMLDFFCSDDPNDYIAGFPDHPHRGFITLTYMLDGHMLHQDSMGNKGHLHSGGAQWMKAASGVIHSEMPQQEAGLMRGFQLWINLPARDKMTEPAYQEFMPTAIPVVEEEGRRVKILSGFFNGRHGPIEDPLTRVHYLDVALAPGKSIDVPAGNDRQGFVYVFEGSALLAETPLVQHDFAALGDGDTVVINAGPAGARFILASGIPINEPIVQYGPFVMNSQAEVQQAFADYRNGMLVQGKASFASA